MDQVPSFRAWAGRCRRWRQVAAAGLLGFSANLHAGGVITNLTYETLSAAMLGGGVVKIQTAGSVTVSAPFAITLGTVVDAAGYQVTLSGGGTNPIPIFVVAPSVTLALNALTLSNGRSTNGGAIQNRGGVVQALDCTFSQNTAEGAAGTDGSTGGEDFGIGQNGGHGGSGGLAQGGAIYNGVGGGAWLTNCLFTGNRAAGGNGGKGGDGGDGNFQGGNGGNGGAPGPAWGGAIFNQGNLFLLACTFTNNTVVGGDGGAGGAAGAGAWSSAVGDGAGGGSAVGGAIYSPGQATLTNCTFALNSATGGKGNSGGSDAGGEGRGGAAGGAAFGGGFANAGTNQTVNCTFYGNQTTGGAAGDGGGGDWVGGDGGRGGDARGGGFYSTQTAALTNCTLAGNRCTGGAKGKGASGFSDGEDGQDGVAQGANVAGESTPLLLRNTLLADGTAGGNAFGNIRDAGYNLSSDATPALGPTSLTNQIPKLGTLGGYGGPTATLPLLPGSPAIDAAREPAPAADQRGTARPQAAYPDIGAYERQISVLRGQVSRGLQPVAALPVILTYNTASGASATQTTNTDVSGFYSFTNLASGPYQVRLDPASANSFLPAQYGLYLTDLNEAQTNLNFYASGVVELSGKYLPGSGQFQITGAGLPQVNYIIQSRDSLSPAAISWQALSTNRADASGRFQWVDPTKTLPPRRYYRAVAPSN